MKKRTKQLVCAALVGMVSIASSSAFYLTPQAASAYSQMDSQWHNTYGRGENAWWNGSSRANDGPIIGHMMSMLIDMDGDGTPELYCCAGEKYIEPSTAIYIQKMYSYDGGMYELNIPKRPSNFENTDQTVVTKFMVGPDRAYLVSGQDTANGGEVSYLTKQGHSIVTAFRYTDYVDADGIRHCTVNGKTVSKAELDAQITDFEKDLSEDSYHYWIHGAEDTHVFDTFKWKNRLFDYVVAFEDPHPTAKTSTHRITLDGSPVSLGAYNIKGNNYFKLRDLASALSGTKAQFDVTWNEAKQRIDLTSGKAYTPVGGEGAALSAGSKTASVTTSNVYLDGKPLNLVAYNIGGNNYFKLRDIGQAIDFLVDWDSSTSRVLINSSKSYAQ